MTTTSNPRNRTMHAFRGLQLCALPMALALLLGPARAQAPEHSTDEAPLPPTRRSTFRRRSLTPASSRA
jgi:hypothetical protein